MTHDDDDDDDDRGGVFCPFIFILSLVWLNVQYELDKVEFNENGMMRLLNSVLS